MKNIILLFLYLLLFNNNLHSQNKITKNGLKTGLWKTEYNREYFEFKREGHYKVISIKSLDTISQRYSYDHFYVKHKNDTAWLDFEERKGDSIVVQDGLWKHYDTTGLRLEYLNKYKRGIILWLKSFNSDGSLSSHTHFDFKKGITYFDDYQNGDLFRHRYYLPKKPNDEIIEYYPNTRLFISNAEPSFNYNFLNKASASQNIQIACKKPLKILSVSPHSSNFQVQFSHDLPLELEPQDTLQLQLNYLPSPATTMEEDTIAIKTLENGKVHEYLIYALTSAVHIDYQNVESTYGVELSQTRDQFLLIDQLGTQTDACVQIEPENICFQLMAGLSPHIRIDLKAFKPGVYSIFIGSCSKFGSFNLLITE